MGNLKSTWLLCEFWDGYQKQRIACSEDKNVTAIAFKWRYLWKRNNTHDRYRGFEWRYSWNEVFVLISVTDSTVTHIAFRRRCLSTKCSLNIRINTSRGKELPFSRTSERLCSPPNLLASAYRCPFPRGRLAGECRQPLTSIHCLGWEWPERYLYSPYMPSWRGQGYIYFLFTIRYTQMLCTCVYS